MSNAKLVFLTALAFLWSASVSAGTQKPEKSSESTKPQVLSLMGTDQVKHVSAKVGQEIIVSIQTIGTPHGGLLLGD